MDDNSGKSLFLKFEGSSVEKHSMKVSDLAPSLNALSDLIGTTSLISYKGSRRIELEIQATNPGSFELVFNLEEVAIGTLAFMASSGVSGALNLKEILFGAHGLVTLVKSLKGRKIIKKEDSNKGVKLTLEESEDGRKIEIEVSVKALELAENTNVRKTLQSFITPLTHDGIEKIELYDINQTINETIIKEDVSAFNIPETQEEEILSQEKQAAFSIVSLAFKDDNKWRLNDGNAIINALILDEEFLSKVGQNLVSFRKNDILICNVRETQWATQSGLRKEYEVLEVKEHHKAPEQINLFKE